jgi:hypothetical protein
MLVSRINVKIVNRLDSKINGGGIITNAWFWDNGLFMNWDNGLTINLD